MPVPCNKQSCQQDDDKDDFQDGVHGCRLTTLVYMAWPAWGGLENGAKRNVKPEQFRTSHEPKCFKETNLQI